MSLDVQLDQSKVSSMNAPNASVSVPFDYSVAFSRTLGWITGYEAQVLRKKRVAVAGLGGVGGHYCEVLARLGVGAFTVADFDCFGIENMNRQAGASMNTLGEPKADVMTRRVLAINPEADIRVFDKGLTTENIDEFLKDVDLYVDGLDFFVLDLRFQLFEALERKGIPYVTIAPLGMGASMVYFDQKSMGFKKYFALKPGLSPEEKAIHFLAGIAPNLKHSRYLVDSKYVDFRAKKGPSTPMACYLCAGIAGTIALKSLLGRGGIVRAPQSMHFDSYTNSLSKARLWFGGYGPLQMLKRAIIRKVVMK